MKQSIIIGFIILGVFYLIGVIIKLPPKSAEQIKAEQQAAVEIMAVQHKQAMELQELRNKEPVRPLTEEQLDAQSTSVGESIAIKLLFN